MVRVVADLIDGRTGISAWSDVFERQLDDVFAVQSGIAGAVARALAATVTAVARRRAAGRAALLGLPRHGCTRQPTQPPERIAMKTTQLAIVLFAATVGIAACGQKEAAAPAPAPAPAAEPAPAPATDAATPAAPAEGTPAAPAEDEAKPEEENDDAPHSGGDKVNPDH